MEAFSANFGSNLLVEEKFLHSPGNGYFGFGKSCQPI